MHSRFLFWLAALLLFLGSQSQAMEPPAEAEKKTEALEPIVVTATKTARNPEDIPASITVLTREDLSRLNIQTVDQALKQVPGTFVSRSNGWGDTMANVNLRGFPADTQKRTLVLLDGQDMSSGYTNSVNWNSLAVEDIERIEVIRGPFSALYGGTAMGGVINIITRTPKKLKLEANVGYGTYDSWTYYLSAGHRLKDRLSLQLSYKYRTTAGYPSTLVTRSASPPLRRPPALQTSGWIGTLTPQGQPTYIIGDTGDNHSHDHIVNGKLSWDLAPGHKINFTALVDWNGWSYGQWRTYLQDVATGAPVFQGTAGLSGAGLQFSGLQQGTFLNGEGYKLTALYTLDTEHRLTEGTTLKFRTGLMDQPDNWYTTPSSSSPFTSQGWGPGSLSTAPSQNWNVELQVDQTLGAVQVLTAGLVYKMGWAATKQYDLPIWKLPHTRGALTYQSAGRDRDFAFYVQDEIAWHPTFTTILGMRLDWWETYNGMYQEFIDFPVTRLNSRGEWSVNPKVAFLWRPLEWMSWRASVGRAFRPPNIYELYRTWRSSSGRIYQSNPNLSPETSLAWEVGATIKPFRGNVIAATFFENYADDLIYRVTDPSDPTGKTLSLQNAAQASIRGVELEITQKLFSWLDVFGNMTIMDARINENPLDLWSVGKKVTFSPRQLFNFGINLNYWKINANLSGHYVSKIHSRSDNCDTFTNVPGSYDPYFTLNAKVTVTPVKWCNISFSVDNIMDRQYYYYYLTPGRTCWLQAGLKY